MSGTKNTGNGKKTDGDIEDNIFDEEEGQDSAPAANGNGQNGGGMSSVQQLRLLILLVTSVTTALAWLVWLTGLNIPVVSWVFRQIGFAIYDGTVASASRFGAAFFAIAVTAAIAGFMVGKFRNSN